MKFPVALSVRFSLLLPAVFLILIHSTVNHGFAQENSKTKAFEKYVDGLFITYDKDDNGLLDEKEIRNMRRKPGDADKDADGSISRDELTSFYVDKMSSRPASQGRSSSRSSARNSSSRSGMASNLGSNAQANDSNTMPRRSAVIDVVIVQFPDATNANPLVEELRGKGFKESRGELRKLASKTENATFDSMQFSSTLGSKSKISVSSQAPVITGSAMNRGGSISRSISNYDLGTTIEILPQNVKGQFVLEIDLAKSIITDSDVALAESEAETTLAKELRNLQFDSTLECASGKTAIFSMTDSGSCWIVALSAR